MKTPALLLTATVAAFALAGCSKPKPVVVDTNPDPMANELAHAKPVELPPAILADKTFRCKDNSLVYVTFFQGNKQVNVRSVANGPPTKLTAPQDGAPYTAEGGWKLTGTQAAITITRPGKDEISCKS